jgi:hypothetical protein
VGLSGAAQVFRIDRLVDEVRKGEVTKHTEVAAFGVTSLWPDEAGNDRLLQLARDHWRVENGQHHRRDRTQDEDRCQVAETNTARVLSLFRSLTIFLYESQRAKKGGKKSLPDFQLKVCRQPAAMIARFMPG